MKILSTNILCILRHLNFVGTVAITSSLNFVNEILVALKKKKKKEKKRKKDKGKKLNCHSLILSITTPWGTETMGHNAKVDAEVGQTNS